MALTKITTSLVAVNTLTAANIADNTIDATKIAQNQILARHIANATALTLDGGVTIDNISIDGTEIDLSSGSLTIDVASDLILDVGNDTIEIRDSGTKFGELISSSTDFVIKSSVSDKDLIFKGNDGGSAITALTLDMSDAGTAKFNNHLHLAGNADIVGQIGAYDNTAASWGAMGFRATNYTFKNSGGTVKVSIDSSGNVGIGETTPLGILHVKDADSGQGTPNESANTLVLEEDDNCGLSIFSGNNDNGMIAFGDAQDADVGSITYDHNTDALNFIVNASQRHTISSTGAAKSTINSDTDYSSTGEPAGILTLYNSNGSDGAGVNNYSSLEFNTGDGATSQGFINYVRTADNQGSFTFSQRTGSSSYAESMRIDNSGNLAIGRTDPSRLLDVKLTATNGSLHNNSTAAVHFGSQGNADGYIQGISLGYKTDGANTYAKTAIVARGLNDGAARQSLAFLVDTAADSGSAEIGDAKLLIDGTTGLVTMPAQPAFRAYLGTSTAVSAGTANFYASSALSEDFDRGGNFNPSTGKFTAPVAGIYHFSATITMGAATTAVEYLSAEIVATPSGGSATRYVCGGWNSKATGDNAYSSSAGSVTIELAASAEVTLGYEVSDAITLQGGIGHCGFSGFLVA